MKHLAEMLANFSPPVLRGTCPCGKPSVPGRECAECHQLRDRRRDVAQKLSESLPEEHRSSRFDALELATKWVKPCPGQSAGQPIALAKASASHPRVVLTGASGTGKTTLAVCMARRWAYEWASSPAYEAGQAPLFASCVALASSRMRTSGREAPLVLAAIAAPLLVLDDLGNPKSEPPSSPIVDVIWERVEKRRPTWITTWLSPDDCTARYGDGVTRRVFERARIIRLEGSP
jgi:DNA replication protein DnaC